MRLTIVLTGLIATGFGFAAVMQSPPAWLAASDGGNWTAEEALCDSTDQRRDLDEEGEMIRQRTTLTEDIATRLCEGQLTLTEAIDAIEPLVRISPRWFRSVRLSYQSFSRVSPTATEREVIVVYLLHKIGQLADQARERGDMSRATAISARRAELEHVTPAQPFPTQVTVGTH